MPRAALAWTGANRSFPTLRRRTWVIRVCGGEIKRQRRATRIGWSGRRCSSRERSFQPPSGNPTAGRKSNAGGGHPRTRGRGGTPHHPGARRPALDSAASPLGRAGLCTGAAARMRVSPRWTTRAADGSARRAGGGDAAAGGSGRDAGGGSKEEDAAAVVPGGGATPLEARADAVAPSSVAVRAAVVAGSAGGDGSRHWVDSASATTAAAAQAPAPPRTARGHARRASGAGSGGGRSGSAPSARGSPAARRSCTTGAGSPRHPGRADPGRPWDQEGVARGTLSRLSVQHRSRGTINRAAVGPRHRRPRDRGPAGR